MRLLSEFYLFCHLGGELFVFLFANGSFASEQVNRCTYNKLKLNSEVGIEVKYLVAIILDAVATSEPAREGPKDVMMGPQKLLQKGHGKLLHVVSLCCFHLNTLHADQSMNVPANSLKQQDKISQC